MYEPERSLQNNLFFWSSANFLTAFKFNALKENPCTCDKAHELDETYHHCVQSCITQEQLQQTNCNHSGERITPMRGYAHHNALFWPGEINNLTVEF